MAFYECIDKVRPFITTETVFDNVITFNDTYGNIPLVTCDSLISGYQEGSGTPSPSNVRPLHAFSSGTLTDNGNTHLFTFGTDIYSGSIDWLRGVVICTHIFEIYDGSVDEEWASLTGGRYYISNDSRCRKNQKPDLNYFDSLSAGSSSGLSDWQMRLNANYTNLLFQPDSTITDLSSWVNYISLHNIQIALELATPIEIPLGGIQVLTNQGVNTYSCNTGDTTIEYININ